MMCLHIKSQMFNSSGSLIIAIKVVTNNRLNAASMLLFYILEKRKDKLACFSKMLLYVLSLLSIKCCFHLTNSYVAMLLLSNV